MQRGKVKLDEDLRPDREDDFQTDDEENQAQRVFEHLDDDTDSDNSPPSPSLSNDVSMISWPQSYRIVNAKQNRLTPLHMDLDKKKTLKITGLTKIIIFMSLKLRARQINETLMGKDFWIKKRRRQNRGEQSLSGENSTTFAERIKMSKSEASTKRTRPVVSKMKKAKKLRMSSSTKDRPEEFENYDDGLST
ncbi:hypothetical protein VIGAN_04187300 [Vigna angularis var. angularis]|uniref:Uncharacterized protein n=1 Tax=Vigna angularis var. angularis TaxID=157739 RepID=A0A0S3RVK1_PHAAN|nr:hypothetical protein VIGAN_04187300 [Vigna angularis var. angularis]